MFQKTTDIEQLLCAGPYEILKLHPQISHGPCILDKRNHNTMLQQILNSPKAEFSKESVSLFSSVVSSWYLAQ